MGDGDVYLRHTYHSTHGVFSNTIIKVTPAEGFTYRCREGAQDEGTIKVMEGEEYMKNRQSRKQR